MTKRLLSVLLLTLGLAACWAPAPPNVTIPTAGQCLTEIEVEDLTIRGYTVIACESARAQARVVETFTGDGSCPAATETLFIEEASGPISKLTFVCVRPL